MVIPSAVEGLGVCLGRARHLSDSDYFEIWETGPIQAFIKSEQREIMGRGVRPNQEIGQDATRSRPSPLTSPSHIALKGAPRNSPNTFTESTVHSHIGILEERIKKRLGSARERHQLRKHRTGNDQGSAIERSVQRSLGGCIEFMATIPKRNDDIRVHYCRHRPRNSRILCTIAFLPDGIPGFPMPRYLANGLLPRAGRTLVPDSSLSNSNPSPGRTPRMRRISRGTVICPLLVIRARFCINCLFLTLLQLALLSKSRFWTAERR